MLAKYRPFINLLFFALIAIFLINPVMTAWNALNIWALPDSDDAMRVLEVRAWLNGQAFYDLFNHRVNPPFGGELHWSRLSDAPLAIMQLILRLFLTPQDAEHIAILITPPLLSIPFLYFAIKIANKIYKSPLNFYFVIVLFLMVYMASFQFVMNRIDHHGLQLITLAALTYGLIRNGIKGGIIAGIALGASLTIGFELLPIQLVALSWLIIMWWLQPDKYQNIIFGFCGALLVTITVGFFIDVGPQDYLKTGNDRLSLAQLLPICIGTIFWWLSAKISVSKTLLWRTFALVITGTAVIAVAWQFPMLRKPLYWQIEPLMWKLWFNDAGETFPLYKFPFHIQILGIFFVSCVAVAGLVGLYFKLKSNEAFTKKSEYALIIILLSVTIALTYFYQNRILSQASILAIMVASALLAETYEKNGVKPFLLLAIVFFPQNATNLSSMTANLDISKARKDIEYGGDMRCSNSQQLKQLANLPKGLVATNLSMGAETLLSTHHDVLAMHFHREAGRKFLYKIFLAEPKDAKQLLLNHGINYVAYCANQTEANNFKKFYPASFLGQLKIGIVPDYLYALPVPKNSDVHVFIVKKD